MSRFLNLARAAAGLPECNCLAALVPELKMLVLSFLPAADLCRLAAVSKEFGSLVTPRPPSAGPPTPQIDIP